MTVDPRIFREYDIRGVWEKDLTAEAVHAIGRAYAAYLKEQTGKENVGKGRPKVTIGRDVRLSSPRVFEILCGAMLESGVDVVDIGVCPTPLQYYSLFRLPVDGGIMITASHNPAEFNGMKLSVGRETLFGEYIQLVRRYIEEGRKTGGRGTMESFGIIPDYMAYQREQFGLFDGLKVVTDCGNGAAGLVAPRLLRELGAEVIELYSEPDGRFPNHHPDPTVLGNIQDMVAAVKREKAHIGIGYDGDADRVGILDEDGEMVFGDRLMIIFARDLLKRHPGATVIGEVKCSQTMYDDISARGGNAVMWKTGHSLIKNRMKETGALLAGEMSGHIFFKDRYFGYDDAIYAGMRILEILRQAGPPYSVKALLADVPRMVSTPEIRVDCPDDMKFEVVEKMKKALAGYPTIDIDGVRVKMEGGWGLIRASNTQPALVMRFEAADERTLASIRQKVEGELKRLL
jgi:phosphomannomutase/phosphoglucomutase